MIKYFFTFNNREYAIVITESLQVAKDVFKALHPNVIPGIFPEHKFKMRPNAIKVEVIKQRYENRSH